MLCLYKIRRLALASTALSLVATTVGAPAVAATCTWNGGSGNWGDSSWGSCSVPGVGDDVRIDGGNAISSVVSITDDRSANTVTLDSGDQITMTGGVLRINGGSLVNNGNITIGSNSTLLGQTTAFNITGTGVITLADVGAGAAYLYSNNGVTMTIGSGQTVSGAGYIGANQGLIINAGTINSNGTGTKSIVIDGQGGSGGVGGGLGTTGTAALLNNNVIEATGGGTLTLAAGAYENGAAGVIKAVGAGSVVQLNDDVRVTNGVLASSGGGVIQATNGTQYLQNVTLNSGSTFNITGDAVRVDGSMAVNGTIVLGSSGTLVGETTTSNLTGSGTIQLNDTGGGVATLYDYNGTQMTIANGLTVSGTGNIGANQGVLINNGTITGTATGTGVLTLDAQGGSGGIGTGNGVGTNTNTAFLNNGLIQATGGGTIVVGAGLYENAGSGSIKAVANSTVHFNDDVRILGGTLTSNTGGKFEANNGTQYLQNVTLSNGSVVNITGDAVRIDGTLANNGTITLNTNGTLVGETATSALTGTGKIILNDTGGGVATLYNYNGTQMTIGSGQTVSGTGNIASNQGVLINNGTITGTASGNGILVLDAQGGSGGIGVNNGVGTNTNTAFLNNGLIQETGGGTMIVGAGLYENAGTGSFKAVGGSTIHLNDDVRILNGTLTSDGTSKFEATNGTQYLQNITLSNGSTINVTGDTTRIDGTLVNNGTMTFNTNGTLVGETATSAINGTGNIVLNDTGGGVATLFNYNGTTMTIGSGQTISGTGNIGANQGVLINNGTITGTASGNGVLVFDAQAGSGGIGAGNGVGTNANSAFLNNGLIQETGGGTMVFGAGLYENAGTGSIQAVGGSTIHLNDDVRFIGGTLTSDGTSKFEATSGNQYFQGVTLASGSNLNVSGDTINDDSSLTVNGTVTLNSGGTLRGEAAMTTLDGSGTIILNDTGAGASTLYNYNGTQMTIGSDLIVRGTGVIGINQGVIQNNGNILADGSITIDAQAGSGGIGAGNGLGVGTNVAFLNNGQVQANNGGATLTLVSGLYENTAAGAFSAGTGSTFNMANDASLVNLQNGGVLSKGFYGSFTTGATSTMNLRSGSANSIVTIGTNTPGIDTTVALSGANSVLQVTPLGDGTAQTIDSTLLNIAQSGVLALSNGRVFTATAGAFSNAGEIRLAGGTFGAPAGLTSSGLIDGNGTIATAVTNSGTVVADGGTLISKAITGATGTIQSNAGATLDLSGAGGNSTAAFLTNNGNLALGGNSITVTTDYQNANFGSGNAFNAHADVTGSGKIYAVSATQDLSGAGLSGTTLNVGNVRLGGTSSTTLTITNNGTATTLRGSVQSAPGNTVNVQGSDFVVAANGGKANVTLSYTGTVAGSLAGQSITVANNFDNVNNATLSLAGAAYNAAAATISPNPINLGAARVGGTLTGNVTIANSAPTGAYTEKLAVTSATGANGASSTSTPGSLIAAGSSAQAGVKLSTATSGTLSGTVTYGLATDGTGTSGLAAAALNSQTVTVTGKVYQAAIAQLGTTTVNFGTVRAGATAPTASVSVTNGATGALTDSLNTSVTSKPSNVTVTTLAALAGGQSGNLSFTENTSTAGSFSSTGTLAFTSTDADLAPLALASQQVSFSGTVTQIAVADIFKSGGTGTLTGSGTSYSLDLGSFSGTGSASTDIGVLNAIANLSYDETLNGSFANSNGAGYSFLGQTISGLVGGSSSTGNLLSFNYGGLSDGVYTDILTFNGASHYNGLTDYSLGPITISITARVTGGGAAAVPEPATWSMMLLGFGFVGSSIRRKKKVRATA